jgi:integrase
MVGRMNRAHALQPLPRRRRFQHGSLQKRKSAGNLCWIAFWRQDGQRRGQILGPCSTMSRPEALAEMAKLLQPVNAHAGQPMASTWTVAHWIRDVFFPLAQRKWKLSTAATTGDRIRKHILPELGSVPLPTVTRELLQQFLEQKAAGHSSSLVGHLRWDLSAIFRLAAQDGLLRANPAAVLFTPRSASPPPRRILNPAQVQQIFHVLNVRDQLLVRLALVSGMRPGEILALQWKHVGGDHVQVVHRLYRGQLDRPKSDRSQRTVALSVRTQELLGQWREQSTPAPEDAWVFPSANGKTPLGRDNAWRRFLAPQLKTMGLEWATFQILRRTHASLSRQAGIDPKLVADQLGHGLGVSLDVYTVAGLDQRQQAVEMLETSLRVS